MIFHHLPVLQILIPLLAAPLAMLMRTPFLSWALALVASWASLVVSIALLLRVLAEGVVVYELGDWAAPWGIEYRIDALNGFVLIIISVIGALVVPYAKRIVEVEVQGRRIYLFYTMLLLCMSGLLGITITGDAFNLFVFLEISSLSTYVLISLGNDRRALTAAYRYLIVGTIGATFYIIGVGLLYMSTGSLNITDLARLVPALFDSRTVQAAMAFLTLGLSIKAAVFPLHLWMPNAYTYAPSAVTVFLAATATKVAIYALIRVVFTIFGGVGLFDAFGVNNTLMAMAIIAMLAGSLVALYQGNIKRMLAYSSIAQIGYIVLGLSLDSVTGVTAGIVHLFNHALTKGGLFMAMGCVAMMLGSVRLDDMAGLGKRMPITMAAFVAGGLSLIGVPLTVGFISKWYLIKAALEQGSVLIAMLIVFSSLIAVAYVWRVVEVAYFRQPADASASVREAPASMLIPMLILIGASVYFGIDASMTLDVAGAAAAALMGAAG